MRSDILAARQRLGVASICPQRPSRFGSMSLSLYTHCCNQAITRFERQSGILSVMAMSQQSSQGPDLSPFFPRDDVEQIGRILAIKYVKMIGSQTERRD